METKYECYRCGRAAVAAHMTYSRWTRNRYCSDLTACDRRAARRLARRKAVK